jgi:hypothetical protein
LRNSLFVLFFVCVAAAAAFVFPLVQEKIEHRMLVLREYLISKLEERIQREISYDAVSPSIFRAFEISNLRIRDKETSRLLLGAGSLRIHYNPVGILFGSVQEAVREIVLENASLNFDTDLDADLFAPSGARGESPDFLSRLLDQRRTGTRITGRNISLRLKSGDKEVRAEKMFFQLRPGQNEYDLRLKSVLSYEGGGEGLLRSGGASLDLRGTLDSSWRSAEATLNLSGLSTNLFDMEKQVFQVSFSPEGLRLRKIQDRTPLDFSLVYTPDTQEISAKIFSRQFTPSGLLTMKSDLAFLNDWLDLSLSSQGEAVYKLSRGELAYAVDFETELKNTGFPRETRLGGRAEGTGEVIRLLPLRLSGSFGLADFRGELPFSSLYPAGSLNIKNFTLMGPEAIHASLRLARDSDGVRVSGERVSWGKSVFRDFFVNIRRSPQSLFFEGGLGFASAEEARGSFSFFVPMGKNGAARKFSLSLHEVPTDMLRTAFLNFSPNNPAAGLLVLLDDEEDLRVTAAVSGQNSGAGWSFSLPGLNVFRRDNRLDYTFSASANYEARRWEVGGWDLRWGAWYGQGNISGEALSHGGLRFSCALNIMGVAYSFGGTYDPAGYLHIDGNYGMMADLKWRPWEDYTGIVVLEEFPVPLRYDVMKISSVINFRYADKDSWGLRTSRVRVTRFAPFAHIRADMDFAVDLGPEGGRLTGLRYADSVSTLEGAGEIAYSTGPVRANGRVSLNAGSSSVEQYGLSVSYADESFAGQVVFTDLPLERFSARDLAGKLSGQLDFSGLPEDPFVRLRLDSSDARFQSQSASLHFDGKLENRVFSISALDASYSMLRLSDTLVEYSLDEGSLNLAALARKGSGEDSLIWFVGGGFVFKGRGEAENGGISLQRILDTDVYGQIQFSTPSAHVVEELRNWHLAIEKTGRDTRISGGYNNSLDAVYRSSGNFSLSMKPPFPLTFEAEGFFAAHDLEANINRISFKVEDFSWLFNFGILRLTRGQALGNLRITGSPLDPDIYGTLAVMDGYADLEVMPEELGPYRGNIIFREKHFSVQPMIVPAGAGSAEVSAEFQLDRWAPVFFSVLIDTQDSPGVHIARNFDGIVVDGIAQGVLRVAGDMRRVNVEGQIIASRTLFTTGDSQEKTAADPGKISTSVRMDIEAGSGVEIILPTADFPILQTFADLGEKITFEWEEETGDFRLTGEVRARGGEIFWFDRRFFIREGFARFNELAGSFDPYVSVRAEMRETTTDGLVRIYLISDLVPASRFSPRFESDRGYTNAEILAVLGTSPFGTSGEDAMNIASAVPFTGDILTQIGVVKTLEKSIRDLFHLDLFSVRTHVVQNILQNAVSPNRQQETDLRERERYREIPTFGRYLDKTSLFLGKYIGSDLFLDFHLQFRAEDIYAREEDAFGGLVLDAEFILECRTPFFNLEWSLMPRHPDELFIFDNVLTFRWRFAF